MGGDMTKVKSEGKCGFCQESFDGARMGGHLETCQARKESVQKETEEYLRRPSKEKANRIYGIKVWATYLPEYWIYLEMDGSAALSELDQFLKNTWVECCDHMSCFTIQGTEYEATPFMGGPAPSSLFGFDRPKKKGMEASVFRIFSKGLEFHYEYDYGSTTELDLKILWERESPRQKSPVRILARNAPPSLPCIKCGKAGEFLCPECSGEEEAYCEKCLRKHPCGDDMALPLVNSPRSGVCGYTGPWDEDENDSDEEDEDEEVDGNEEVLDTEEDGDQPKKSHPV
jgi:hypothetical protein